MFLVDTSVISSIAPTKREKRAELADWMEAASPFLFLSVITTAEVSHGIAKARRQGASAKATALEEWWKAIEHLYGDRILPFDQPAATLAGQIMDRARAHDPGFEDIAIAATAGARGLTVLTTNERHFAPLGVKVINPLLELPAL